MSNKKKKQQEEEEISLSSLSMCNQKSTWKIKTKAKIIIANWRIPFSFALYY